MAVVVSYNFGEGIQSVIAELKEQVGQILIVDNGSEPETVRILKRIATDRSVKLIQFADNNGVGAALNAGIQTAVDQGFTWLLTMDQDSSPSTGMVSALVEAAEVSGGLYKILSPNLFSETNRQITSGRIGYAITSGNLIHLSVFRAIGQYRDDYFIDCIDFEFSLRARRAGYDICRVAGAFMQHEVGHSIKRVPNLLAKFYTQHSPLRRYYSFRNSIILCREYFRYFPWFISKLLILQFVYFVLVAVFDVDRLENLKKIGRGVSDGVRGRTGKYGGPTL